MVDVGGQCLNLQSNKTYKYNLKFTVNKHCPAPPMVMMMHWVFPTTVQPVCHIFHFNVCTYIYSEQQDVTSLSRCLVAAIISKTSKVGIWAKNCDEPEIQNEKKIIRHTTRMTLHLFQFLRLTMRFRHDDLTMQEIHRVLDNTTKPAVVMYSLFVRQGLDTYMIL